MNVESLKKKHINSIIVQKVIHQTAFCTSVIVSSKTAVYVFGTRTRKTES